MLNITFFAFLLRLQIAETSEQLNLKHALSLMAFYRMSQVVRLIRIPLCSLDTLRNIQNKTVLAPGAQCVH